jgi:hypothetical protein
VAEVAVEDMEMRLAAAKRAKFVNPQQRQEDWNRKNGDDGQEEGEV